MGRKERGGGRMNGEEREWLNSYREKGPSNLRSENPERKSMGGDIQELSDAIKEVEGPEALKIELMEHIQVVVRENNLRFVRLESERRLKEIEKRNKEKTGKELLESIKERCPEVAKKTRDILKRIESRGD
ncbi:MAG TPA: hypothetical protein VMW67_02325 [Desulfobacteria bacterium]|nr:hypothetical protein [Desulfobacteria bacterium]